MSFDTTNKFKEIGDRINAIRTFKDLKSDALDLEKKINDNLEDLNSNLTKGISDISKNVENQFDKLVELIKFNKGNGNDTTRYIKDKLTQTIYNITPKVNRIIYEESIKSLGCSQEQTFQPSPLSAENNGIYIDLKSIDLFQLLKNDPNDSIFSVSYEPTSQINSITYSMNRLLYDRIMNVRVPKVINGKSGKELFNISYETTNEDGITGDFLKINLSDRSPNENKITKFLTDYYESINIIDNNVIISTLINSLTGSVDMQLKPGQNEIRAKKRFEKIIQRILGICFDFKEEIDVSGNAKVSELENLDESFFELNSVELRTIENEISNIVDGVVEFEDCDNVKLPVNFRDINNTLLKFNDNQLTEKEFIKLTDELLDTIVESNDWKLAIPNISLKVKNDFIKQIPLAFAYSILTPKVLLPIIIMSKALGQRVSTTKNINTYIKENKTFIINVITRINAIFIEELFQIIKSDILKLIGSIRIDFDNEKKQKKYELIFTLINIALTVVSLIRDYRKCNSVLDEILRLINLLSTLSRNSIPPPLLFFSGLLPGFSETRAAMNVIQEFQKFGLPTGDYPDGTPNLYLLSIISQIRGTTKERNQNEKIQMMVPSLTITPLGITIPTPASGKPI